MKNFIATIIAAPFMFLLMAGSVCYLAFSWGYVTLIFWGWFVVPAIPHAPIFTWAQLAGFILVVECFTHTTPTAIKKEFVQDYAWLNVLFAPWIALFCGWLFHFFIY